ncbi:hypothetical protein BURK2_03268 [Burkholderiales bacterium]|nr:hypothetical protein BURK2_03268 [Burkholderiales bacterium]
MNGFDALWGGFTAFFSIWQLCILQFSPFFLAFIVGAYFVTPGQNRPPPVLRWTLPAFLTWALVFTLLYSLLIASALPVSRPLINHLGTLRILGGVFILLASLYLFFASRLVFLREVHSPGLLVWLALAMGLAFALMYSPCITPMLSDIMGLASQRSTAMRGWFLAFFYGLGTCLAMGLVSLALIAALVRHDAVWPKAQRIADACALVLLILAIMNLTGLMTLYKAFLLGLAL